MLLSSGDIAAAVGRTSGAVRAWEREGKIPKGARPEGRSHRKWEASAIAPILTRWGYTVPESWGVVASVAA
jgi:hypothetical protein